MTKNEAYKLLADLVFKGFLTVRMEIAGKSFVFKTINEREYDLIKLYSGFSDGPPHTLRFNLNYLVASLLTIDDENILKRKDYDFREYYKFFSELPHILYVRVLEELLQLRGLAIEVTEYLEGFSYTSQSRSKWSFMKDAPYSQAFTGIPGTDRLGINVYQENWVLINKMLDKEEQYNKDFSLALLIASAQNPKGARSVRGKHDSAVERSDERRKKLAKVGSLKQQSWTPKGWAQPVDTAEELVAELQRQMDGRKDKHDVFIDDYMKKLREQAEEQSRKAEERIKAARERREAEGDIPAITGSQRVLTPEEMAEIKLENHNNLSIVESEEVASDGEKDRFLSKIGSKVLKARK